MQERRTLAYIDKDDIPSSAVELTSSNYSSIYGNVIYIPTYLTYTGTMTLTYNGESYEVTCDGIHVAFVSDNKTGVMYVEYNNMEISSTLYLYNGINIILPSITKKENDYYYYGGISTQGSSLGYLYPNTMNFKIGHESKPYIKLKFSKNVHLSLMYRSDAAEVVNGNSNLFEEYIPKLPPFYIDNE